MVANDADVIADQRFPLTGMAPVDRHVGQGRTAPALRPGPGEVLALVDPMRSVDKRRGRRVFGRTGADGMGVVDNGLGLFLGLGAGS